MLGLKRCESGHLEEVHASVVDMDAEIWPARAAALLAGKLLICFVNLKLCQGV
jgi:hypothetical protein